MNASLLQKTVSPLKLHFMINFDFAKTAKHTLWHFIKKDGRITGAHSTPSSVSLRCFERRCSELRSLLRYYDSLNHLIFYIIVVAALFPFDTYIGPPPRLFNLL